MPATERITRENVNERVRNLNRRMESRGSTIRYFAESRNGHIGLDRFSYKDPENRTRGITVLSTVTAGTKREIADFLHAMMVALDDAAVQS